MNRRIASAAEVWVLVRPNVGQDPPAALALGTGGLGRDDRDAGHVISDERAFRGCIAGHGDSRGDTEFGEVDRPDQRAEEVLEALVAGCARFS